MLWAALSLPPDDPLRVMAEWDPLNTCPRAGGATVQQHARGAVFSSAALKYVAGLSGDQARPGGGAHPGCARAAGERRRCPEPEDDTTAGASIWQLLLALNSPTLCSPLSTHTQAGRRRRRSLGPRLPPPQGTAGLRPWRQLWPVWTHSNNNILINADQQRDLNPCQARQDIFFIVFFALVPYTCEKKY